jgi:lysophospholipase L1-like esterase
MNRIVLALITLALFITNNAFACPGKNGILDYNCDGVVKIFFIGDSFVFGFGDTVNDNKGGYVKRLKKSLSKVTVESYGVQGLRAVKLLPIVLDTFKVKDPYPAFRKSLNEADAIILDVGRNDRWLMGEPSATYNILNRITKQIARGVLKDTGYEPMVIKAVLMLPNRGSQGPWVKLLNEIILAKSTNRFPSDLRFDLVSKRLIGKDQIHPTPLGYTTIAKAFRSYIPDLTKHFKARRPDTDLDGISDLLETKKFLTDPNISDTDSDGKSDTDEIFTTLTNPLVAD